MSDRAFDDLAASIEAFVAHVDVYETLVGHHRPDDQQSRERIDRYITEGVNNGDSLVDTWMEAADAAEELRDHDYSMGASGKAVDKPSMQSSSQQNRVVQTVDRERQAYRLWNDFFEAQQTITAHEQYALRHFDRSPVEYRMEVDPDYGSD